MAAGTTSAVLPLPPSTGSEPSAEHAAGGDDPPPISYDGAKGTVGAPASPPPAPASATQADAVLALTTVYGPAGSTGLGSAVFQQDALSAESLNEAALAKYRQFVGALWETREADWRTGFRELCRRPQGDTGGLFLVLLLD